MTELWCLMVEKDYFSRCSLRFQYFPDFDFFPIWTVQKCSSVIFGVLDEKVSKKHVSRRPNPKFSV